VLARILARNGNPKTIVRCPRDARFRGTCFGVSVQQVRAVSALVRLREVPMKEFPLQCPWCVPLPVPVVQLFLVLHIYNRSVL